MTIAIAEIPLSHNRTVEGESEQFRELLEAEREINIHARAPISRGGWKSRLFDDVIDIGNECSETGWDGYEALPVSQNAILTTLCLIQELPEWVPIPEIVPSLEGNISFEWHSELGRVLSVTPENEILLFAAVLAPNETLYGRTSSQGEWPDKIIYILFRHFLNA